MHLIINNSSMQPIYEQIVGQIKEKIQHGELQQEEALPSVRTLSRELIVTVHGKGSFVAAINNNVALEEQRREVEAAFEEAIRKARSCGMTKEEISQLLDIMMED